MKNKGKVIFFDAKKGYGFIEWFLDNKKQKDMFCHYSDIQVDGFKTLKKDQKVEFEVGQNVNGDPKAVKIVATS
ncbi:MAG: cold shock domain-containing protein [Chitinophagales bacterium]|nr:cold shock domain-containing protein [Chitinophagales bacterium]